MRTYQEHVLFSIEFLREITPDDVDNHVPWGPLQLSIG
jgi:hypothetical protein